MATRISGLTSGLDVDKLVQDMMKARRASYDSMYQKKTALEWKKADYSTMYTTINDFRNKTVFNYKLENTLVPKKTVSSNEAAVSVSANADAGDISYSVNVLQLADGVKKTSVANISTGDKSTIATQFGVAAGTNYTFTLKNGSSSANISFSSDDSIYDLAGKINSAGINVKASYDTTLDRFFIYTTNSGSTSSLEFSGADAGFIQNQLKINTSATSKSSTASVTTGSTGGTLAQQFTGLSGIFDFNITNAGVSKTISVDADNDTMAGLINKINTAGANVSANYDAALDRFTISATNTSNVSAGIDFTGSSAAGLSFLSDNLKFNTTAAGQTGKDAVVDIDGIAKIAQASNTFTLSGVTYNLKSVGSSTVTVSPDNDKLTASIKDFITAYNSTLDKLNGEINEAKYKDFLPLTDAQKSDMTESDIKAWEEKAKSGALRRNPILQDLVTKMRGNVSAPVSGLTGKYNSAASIGITTGDYSENGKLYLDENKLKAALEADPESVYKIFGTDGSSSGADGIAVRLYDTLKSGTDKIFSEAGLTASTLYDSKSNLAKQISSYEKRMSDLDSRLQDEEDRYYRQFDAMESAINRMNQQSAWLSQQLGGQS